MQQGIWSRRESDMNKTELLIQLNRLPETRALWNRDAVLRFARGGEQALSGKLRMAPASMTRLFKVIVDKLFALDKYGTDFSYQPERVEADGFRPYFVDDLMKWTGITCRDTITKGLRWLAQAGIISLRKPIKDGLTGQFGFAMIRFNPGILEQIAERVITILVAAKNAVKKGSSKLSPSRMHSGSSSVSSPGVPSSGGEQLGKDSVPEGDAQLLSSKDQKLEEVVSVLKDTYPDVATLQRPEREQLRKLVHCIFPRYRLTVERARELVRCKKWDDESGSDSNDTNFLQGFQRFDKFVDLLPYWKSHIAKILRGSMLSTYDRRVEEAVSYQSTVTDMPEFAPVVQALQTNSGWIKSLAMKARGYLLNNDTAYATLVRQFPALQQWCEIRGHDHERLMRAHRKQETKIEVWTTLRPYLGIQ